MALEFKLPDIGEGITEGEIVKWLVNTGDTVKEDQPLVEIMTDKVTAEIPSPSAGVIQECRGKEGEVIDVGAVIVVLETETSVSTRKKEVKAPVVACNTKASATTSCASPSTAMPLQGNGAKILAAPATRKLGRELGIDLSVVSGTGPRGRITQDDVKNSSKITPPNQKAQSKTGFAGERRVPFIGMRRRIGEHLVKSKQTAPHFGYVEEVDMTELVSLRKQLKGDAEAQGVKLTYLPFIMKAVILGLQKFPSLNSSLDDAKGELVYKNDYHMGVATATDDGLIVPVVKFADQKSLYELATEIQDLSLKARNGQLKPDDVSGGTFTLTSIGSIGGLFSIPIINHPEVGIMGINKIEKRAVVRNNEIVIRDMMHLSICCDHRVVDGSEAALFVKYVIEYLEQPARLLL